MVNSCSNTMLITLFISSVSNKNIDYFPINQINQYCSHNTFTLDKIQNIIHSETYKFNRTYVNFKQTILLYFMAITKITQSQIKFQSNPTCANLIRCSLDFIEDLITSKMYLACLYTRSKLKHNIQINFIYLENFINVLIPRLLQQNLQYEIVELIEKINNEKQIQQFSSVNFLAEYILIINTYNYLTEESSKKFKQFILSVTKGTKKMLLQNFWTSIQVNKKQLNFNQLIYFRTNLQSYKNNCFFLENDKVIYYPITNTVIEDWIINAYEKDPSTINISHFNSFKNVQEIYKFLFKLEVFASSPKIQQLDSIIPHEEFLDLFSKFLMGERLQEQKVQKVQNAFQRIQQFHNFIINLQKPYRNVVSKQIIKILQTDEQDSNLSKNQQIYKR